MVVVQEEKNKALKHCLLTLKKVSIQKKLCGLSLIAGEIKKFFFSVVLDWNACFDPRDHRLRQAPKAARSAAARDSAALVCRLSSPLRIQRGSSLGGLAKASLSSNCFSICSRR